MDQDGKLANLKNTLHNAKLVKSIEDLKVGTVVYVEMDANDGLVLKDEYKTRLKYVVVAGTKSNKKEICAVLINSDADFSTDPEWKAEQVPLSHQIYPEFLDYNSWVDCTDPKILMVRKLKSKNAEISGSLTEDDMNVVLDKLKKSDFVDSHMKKVFGLNKQI